MFSEKWSKTRQTTSKADSLISTYLTISLGSLEEIFFTWKSSTRQTTRKVDSLILAYLTILLGSLEEMFSEES